MSYVIYNIRIFHTILPQIFSFFLFKQSVSSGLSCFSVVVWHYSWLTENKDWRWPLTTAGNDCDVWWTGTRRSPTLGNAQRLNLLDASLMNMSFICCTLESIHPWKMNDNRYDALLMHPFVSISLWTIHRTDGKEMLHF